MHTELTKYIEAKSKAKKKDGQYLTVNDLADFMNLEERLSFISNRKMQEIKEAHHNMWWGQNPTFQWDRLMSGKVAPNFIEVMIFCEHLNCTVEELINPNFSFADREYETRQNESEVSAHAYNLNYKAA